MDLNHFDKISVIYDGLTRLVFGKSIVNSQKYFLNRIPDHSKILILGGGTGWVLVNLLNAKPDCEVWYIEASAKMIALAKRKIRNSDRIHFIHGTENDIPDIKFDIAITNFYLDLFASDSLSSCIERIKNLLAAKAQWIVTDFVDSNKLWQKLMLRIMYFFFRIVCNIESKKLPDWNKAILEVNGRKTDSKFFYSRFIESALFQF